MSASSRQAQEEMMRELDRDIGYQQWLDEMSQGWQQALEEELQREEE